MSSTLSEEILVARQLSALRGAGWSSLDALSLVVGDLGASSLKARLASVHQALKAGQVGPGAELFTAAIARGDSASPLALDHLAAGLEASQAAQLAIREVRRLALLFVVGLGVLGSVAHLLVPWYGQLVGDHSIPVPVQLLLELFLALRWAAPVATIVGLVLVVRAPMRGLPGARQLASASELLQYTAALESGLGEPEALRLLDPRATELVEIGRLRLDRLEKKLFACVAERKGPAFAARQLAEELTADGERSIASVRRWVPALAAVVAILLGTVVLALLGSSVFGVVRGIS